MAQRTIHYLFAELLHESGDIHDIDRFLVGSVMPDAYIGDENRDKTHFIRREGSRRCFDFEEFRRRYEEKIYADDLYLGYYMHLLEDGFYRTHFHEILHLYMKIEDVERLHQDYHILNRHIVDRYGIAYAMSMPADFDKEELNEIAPFHLEDFLEEMKEDFREDIRGETKFIDAGMLDGFVERYAGEALKELEAIRRKEHYCQLKDFYWEKSRVE